MEVGIGSELNFGRYRTLRPALVVRVGDNPIRVAFRMLRWSGSGYMNISISSREWLLVSAAAAVGGAVFAAAAGAAFALAQPRSSCKNHADFECKADEDRSTISKTNESNLCVCCCESKGRSMRSLPLHVVYEDENFKCEACRARMDGGTELKTMGEKGLALETSTSSLSNGYNIVNAGNKSDPFSPTKRKGYLSWDDYFMAIAFLSAHRSKDPNRQVGACLVSQDRVILGIGYNGFPRGCSDDELPWAKMSSNGDPLQTKYPYVCHAEVNAILNTNHASAVGQRLYVTLFPCNECAKVIIQAGVAEVVYYIDKKNSLSQEFSYVASRRLLSMAGVKVWQHQPTTTQILLEFK